MRFFNAKPNLLTLFLHTILIIQPMTAIPPQELYGEPCQSYAILCVISFFMGTILYVLIHKCCTYQPTPSSIPPTMDKELVKKELMEKLQTMIHGTDSDKHNK